MKKAIALILALCMVLSLAACGGSSNNAPAAKLDRGVISGDTYTNKYFGFSLKLPSGWSFYDDENTAAMSGLKADDLKGDDLSALVDKNQHVMVCYANNNSGNSINIPLNGNMKSTSKYSVEELFNMSLEGTKKQLAESGMDIVSSEILKTKIMGEDQTVLRMDISYMGHTINEFQFWLRDGSDYAAVVTVAGIGLTDPSELFAAFSKTK